SSPLATAARKLRQKVAEESATALQRCDSPKFRQEPERLRRLHSKRPSIAWASRAKTPYAQWTRRVGAPSELPPRPALAASSFLVRTDRAKKPKRRPTDSDRQEFFPRKEERRGQDRGGAEGFGGDGAHGTGIESG